jgi:hypothetical protein
MKVIENKQSLELIKEFEGGRKAYSVKISYDKGDGYIQRGYRIHSNIIRYQDCGGYQIATVSPIAEGRGYFLEEVARFSKSVFRDWCAYLHNYADKFFNELAALDEDIINNSSTL